MHYKEITAPLKMDIAREGSTAAYQIEPYDYYVGDYFLAKSLQHVLRYAGDELLYEVALDEAQKAFKTNRELINKHVRLITKKE